MSTLDEVKKPAATRLWLELFWIFFRVGALTIGGGYTMIPLFFDEIVERRHWMDRETFFGGIALSQGVPGANAFNAAVFLGYRIYGIPGAAASLLGCLLPSLVCILILGPWIFKLLNTGVGERVFSGLRAGILGILLYYLGSWLIPLWRNYARVALFILMLGSLVVLKWHPILVLVVGGLLGFLLSGAKGSRVRHKEGDGN
jgi:chromate transporter